MRSFADEEEAEENEGRFIDQQICIMFGYFPGIGYVRNKFYLRIYEETGGITHMTL